MTKPSRNPKSERNTEDRLDKIFLRLNLLGENWESLSLREIIDRGHAGEIARWFRRRIFESVGLEEGSMVGENHVISMLNMLDELSLSPMEFKKSNRGKL